MSKKMLINATHAEENRVAIVENGILTELGIEVAGREPTKGNIYKAAVVRVEPGLQAAFVDYGAERLGFLQIDEINATVVKPDFKGSGRPRINDLLHRGQEILVQIVKEERGTKGAALTTYLSLAGRYMVLMPGTPTRGVSRKAEDDKQRKQMKKALSSLDLPENVGCIVRTAALDQTREELERDYRYLMRLYENIETLEKKIKAPALIYKESNLVIRSIRDYFTTDMDEVLIDDPEVFREAREFFEVVMPDHAGLVKLHQERRPIFSRFQIEEQIETINRNKVPLPSGGSIVIDTTEALVAIDVNSGKMAGESNVEATATRTNLEAAEEVARQLRLRDLGGLIVIDFIDMRERKHNRQVEDRLKESTARDKARITIGHISQFGMLEMSRQRIKPALTEGAFRTCPHCQGAGQIRSVETLAVSVLRRLHAALAKGQVAVAEAQMAREVASFLLNEKREELVEMERRYQADIQITGRTSFLADQVEIILQKREKEAVAAEYVEAKLTAMPEKPARPAGGEKAAEATAGKEAAPSAVEPAKKKRRRKKKGDEDAGGEHGEALPADAGGDEPTGAVAVADAAEAAAATPAPVEAGTLAKKKRRRRKKRGGAEAETTSESVAVPVEAAMVAETAASVPHPPAADADTHAKKKRRRRKKKGGAEAEMTSESVAVPVEAAMVAETAASVPHPPAADVDTHAKKKRRRRHRKKAGTAETATVAEPAVAAQLRPPDNAEPIPAASPQGVADTTAPGRKKRRVRPQGGETSPVATAPAAAAEPASGEERLPATATKPPKRVRKTRPATDSPATVPETATPRRASAQPVTADAASPPPSAKRPPRPKRPATPAPEEPAPLVASADAEPIKRKRTPRKKPPVESSGG